MDNYLLIAGCAVFALQVLYQGDKFGVQRSWGVLQQGAVCRQWP